MYHKMIVPILIYAAEVRGFHAGTDVESAHLKFLKQIARGKM